MHPWELQGGHNNDDKSDDDIDNENVKNHDAETRNPIQFSLCLFLLDTLEDLRVHIVFRVTGWTSRDGCGARLGSPETPRVLAASQELGTHFSVTRRGCPPAWRRPWDGTGPWIKRARAIRQWRDGWSAECAWMVTNANERADGEVRWLQSCKRSRECDRIICSCDCTLRHLSKTSQEAKRFRIKLQEAFAASYHTTGTRAIEWPNGSRVLEHLVMVRARRKRTTQKEKKRGQMLVEALYRESGDAAQLFLRTMNDLTLSGGGKRPPLQWLANKGLHRGKFVHVVM